MVWYDPQGSYAHAVDRLAPENAAILKEDGGYFQLREELERWMEWLDEEGKPNPDREVPPRVVVYVPRERADSEYVLIEAETAGVVIEPGRRYRSGTPASPRWSSGSIPRCLPRKRAMWRARSRKGSFPSRTSNRWRRRPARRRPAH